MSPPRKDSQVDPLSLEVDVNAFGVIGTDIDCIDNDVIGTDNDVIDNDDDMMWHSDSPSENRLYIDLNENSSSTQHNTPRIEGNFQIFFQSELHDFCLLNE